MPFTNYTTAQGLIHNRTHCVCQDGQGYIWIGTDHGICRYDGRNFKHYSPKERPFLAARYCTRYKDSVYFCIDQWGIAVCCGDSVRIVKSIGYTGYGTDGVVPVNDSTYLVNLIPSGLYNMNADGNVKKISLPGNTIDESGFVDIYKDSKGNIWEHTAYGLMLFMQGDYSKPLIPLPFKGTFIYVIREDKQGNIYIACKSGLYRYTAQQCKDIMKAVPLRLNVNFDITALELNFDGYIWMGTFYNGLIKYDIKKGTYKEYGMTNGMTSQNVWGLCKDREQNLWVATENGVSKLTTTNFYTYDYLNTAFQMVKSGCEWDDSTFLYSNLVDIYAHSNEKVTKLKGYKNEAGFTEDLMVRTPEGKLIYNLTKGTPDGRFYVHTTRCEIRNNTLTNKVNTGDLPGGPDLVFLGQGFAYYGSELWVSTTKGLQVYKDGRFYNCYVPKLDSEKTSITYIEKGPGNTLWMLRDYKDLISYSIERYPNDSFYARLIKKEIIHGSKLGNQFISRLFADSKGNIWLCGRERGLVLLKTNSQARVVSINTSLASRLSSIQISCFTEDDEHNIWIGTSMGLDKLTPSADSFILEKDVHGSEFCGKYIYFVKSHNHKLFVGTSGCVGIINLNGKEDTSAPLIYITAFKINEQVRNSLLQIPGVDLQPDENNISFTFTGLSYKAESKIKYSYLLEGVDDNWSQPQTEYTIHYSKLLPGTYTFKVKAISARGIWSKEAATFTFTIIQPFYTRWWFISVVICIVAVIVYAIYRYRINQLLAIQGIRQSISKDLHDDIGATVSSINILANMAKSDLISESKRNQFLETIQDESKHVSESLSDIVWSINPKNDSLEIMFARMQRYASELFEAKNIGYEFILPDIAFDELSMDMNKRQQVYLIFKEAVNNLAKYSEATHARITLMVNKNVFTMVIADNGRGFDMSMNYAGNGIINMKKRALDAGGILKVDSAPDAGTHIGFTMPF